MKNKILKYPIRNGLALGLVVVAFLFLFSQSACALFFTFTPLTVMTNTNAVTTWPVTNDPPCVIGQLNIPTHTVQVTSSNIPTSGITLYVKLGVDGAVFPLTITNFTFATSNDTEYLITPAYTVNIYGQLAIALTNNSGTNQKFGAAVIQ